MARVNELDAYWEFLIDNFIATEEELQLVTSINGYSKETLDDILYVRTGNRSKEQYCDENDIECEEESLNTITSVTNKILEGHDITHVIGMQTEASTVLRDNDITSTDDVEELSLYIINDGDLYRSRTLPIIYNLQKKYRNGTYDKDLAVKAFMYLVDDGIKKYAKEFRTELGNRPLKLDKNTRVEIAKELRDHYEEHIMEEE